MCGIAGIFRLDGGLVPRLESALAVQTDLIAHRGPDGEGTWISSGRSVGLTHRRLAIIDLSEAGAQPMHGPNGTVITYNGEIYNYRELRSALADRWRFRTESDTECILASYEIHGARFPFTPARHVCFRAVGRAQQAVDRGAGSVWHQAILLRGR